jgi:hypothetical protein
MDGGAGELAIGEKGDWDRDVLIGRKRMDRC